MVNGDDLDNENMAEDLVDDTVFASAGRVFGEHWWVQRFTYAEGFLGKRTVNEFVASRRHGMG